MAKIVNKSKVITGPRTRCCYAHLWDPKCINGGTPNKRVNLFTSQSD